MVPIAVEVAADRPLETAADPGVEPGLPALLDRQGRSWSPTRWCGCAWAPRCTSSTCGPWARRSAAACVILSPHVPVCTDLLTIGARQRDPQGLLPQRLPGAGRASSRPARSPSARACSSVRTPSSTSTPRSATAAQLGHASALHAGQAVPAGQCWHGSPRRARRRAANYQAVGPGPLRHPAPGHLGPRGWLVAVAVIGPLEAAAAILLLSAPAWSALPARPARLTSWMYERRGAGDLGWRSCFGRDPAAGCSSSPRSPGCSAGALQPGKVYPLYGVHYALQRLVAGLTNVKFFNYLFGDSSAIVYYLRALGYRLTPIEQTGSNFGTDVKHEMPTLSTVGTGHDGLRRPVLHQRRILRQLLPGRCPPPSAPGTSSGTTSPTRPAAGPATTACSPPRP